MSLQIAIKLRDTHEISHCLNFSLSLYIHIYKYTHKPLGHETTHCKSERYYS